MQLTTTEYFKCKESPPRQILIWWRHNGENHTLLCTYRLQCGCSCVYSAQILYSVFASSGVQQYAGELVNANECMEYDASPHNFNTTVCKCAYVDI